MVNSIKENLKKIIELHKGNQIKYPSLITAQGVDGSHNIIQFETMNFSKEIIHDSIDIINFFENLFVNDKEMFFNAIINTCQIIYLTHSINRQLNIDDICTEYATIIENFLLNKEQYFVEIRVFPEITHIKNPSGWHQHHYNNIEKSIFAHKSGISSSDFLKRLANSVVFRKNLNKFINKSYDGVVEEVERDLVAFGLGLKYPVVLDEIKIISEPWFAYPSSPFQFQKMWGYWENNTYDANTAQFFSRQRCPPFDYTDHSEDITKWSNLLSEKDMKGAIFPFTLILRGLLNMLSSVNGISFGNRNKALIGIHDALVGMDGLIRYLREEKYGHQKVFIKTWKDIVKKLGYCSHKSIIKNLYFLRCSLAHGDPDDVKSQLKNAKLILGDKYNKNNYDAPSFGWEFGHFLIKVIELFSNEPELLRNLYQIKNNNSFFTKILQFLKVKL